MFKDACSRKANPNWSLAKSSGEVKGGIDVVLATLPLVYRTAKISVARFILSLHPGNML